MSMLLKVHEVRFQSWSHGSGSTNSSSGGTAGRPVAGEVFFTIHLTGEAQKYKPPGQYQSARLPVTDLQAKNSVVQFEWQEETFPVTPFPATPVRIHFWFKDASSGKATFLGRTKLLGSSALGDQPMPIPAAFRSQNLSQDGTWHPLKIKKFFRAEIVGVSRVTVERHRQSSLRGALSSAPSLSNAGGSSNSEALLQSSQSKAPVEQPHTELSNAFPISVSPVVAAHITNPTIAAGSGDISIPGVGVHADGITGLDAESHATSQTGGEESAMGEDLDESNANNTTYYTRSFGSDDSSDDEQPVDQEPSLSRSILNQSMSEPNLAKIEENVIKHPFEAAKQSDLSTTSGGMFQTPSRKGSISNGALSFKDKDESTKSHRGSKQDRDGVVMDSKYSITIVHGRNLLPADRNGFSDPFVEVFETGQKSPILKTAVIKKTLNPDWSSHNEQFQIDLAAPQAFRSFTFKMFDKDIFGQDFLGECVLDLSPSNIKSLIANSPVGLSLRKNVNGMPKTRRSDLGNLYLRIEKAGGATISPLLQTQGGGFTNQASIPQSLATPPSSGTITTGHAQDDFWQGNGESPELQVHVRVISGRSLGETASIAPNVRVDVSTPFEGAPNFSTAVAPTSTSPSWDEVLADSKVYVLPNPNANPGLHMSFKVVDVAEASSHHSQDKIIGLSSLPVSLVWQAGGEFAGHLPVFNTQSGNSSSSSNGWVEVEVSKANLQSANSTDAGSILPHSVTRNDSIFGHILLSNLYLSGIPKQVCAGGKQLSIQVRAGFERCDSLKCAVTLNETRTARWQDGLKLPLRAGCVVAEVLLREHSSGSAGANDLVARACVPLYGIVSSSRPSRLTLRFVSGSKQAADDVLLDEASEWLEDMLLSSQWTFISNTSDSMSKSQSKDFGMRNDGGLDAIASLLLPPPKHSIVSQTASVADRFSVLMSEVGGNSHLMLSMFQFDQYPWISAGAVGLVLLFATLVAFGGLWVTFTPLVLVAFSAWFGLAVSVVRSHNLESDPIQTSISEEKLSVEAKARRMVQSMEIVANIWEQFESAATFRSLSLSLAFYARLAILSLAFGVFLWLPGILQISGLAAAAIVPLKSKSFPSSQASSSRAGSHMATTWCFEWLLKPVFKVPPRSLQRQLETATKFVVDKEKVAKARNDEDTGHHKQA